MRIFFLPLLLLSFISKSQSVGIGTNSPNSAAMLDVHSSNKGLLIPRVALSLPGSVSPLSGPLPEGIIVYNTTTTDQLTPGFYYWNAANQWDRLSSSTNGAVPKDGIIEFDTKLSVPGYSYIGYSNEDFFLKIGTGSGTWSPLPTFPFPDNVRGSSHAFYANKFYVWSGQDNTYASYPNTGAFLDVSTNTWTPMATANAPEGRFAHTTVIDPSYGAMYIWGGNTSLTNAGITPQPTNSGAEYDFILDSWRPLPTSPLEARNNHAATYFDGKMFIWGGTNGTGTNYADGAIYNRSTNTWTTVAPSPLSPRWGHTAIWTGNRVIIYGGFNGSIIFNDGASYNPANNTWTLIASNPTFGGNVYNHSANWIGTKMLVYGGINNYGTTSIGSIYNLATNSWSSMANSPGAEATSSGSEKHTSIWNGTELIIIGGVNNGIPIQLVKLYNPSTNNWRLYNDLPVDMQSPAAVWTGTALLVQGGSWYHRSGYIFNPLSGAPQDIHVTFKKPFYKYKKN